MENFTGIFDPSIKIEYAFLGMFSCFFQLFLNVLKDAGMFITLLWPRRIFTVAQEILISDTFTAFIGGQYFTFTFYNMSVLFDN